MKGRNVTFVTQHGARLVLQGEQHHITPDIRAAADAFKMNMVELLYIFGNHCAVVGLQQLHAV